VHHMKNTASMVLGLKPENVRVIFKMGSGCYGLNGADAVSYDAALMSQAVGKPVRVQLTRKDEMAWENYGFLHVLDQKAALDANGNIIAWDHESWVPLRGARPNATTPGNVITGHLIGLEPTPFVAENPAPEPREYNNGSNAVPSYVTGSVMGKNFGTGTVISQRVLRHNVESVFFTGPLRAPERLQNTFAHEAFMDEVAAAAKADPLEFRLRHVTDPRLLDVLKAVGKASNWQSRPSPRTDIRPGAIASGRGIAGAFHQGNNGYCAMVAEIDVNRDTGVILVRRLVIAHDCGPISNPNGVENQLQGGALAGLSRSLFEQVTWDDQKITSVDWKSYRAMSLGIELPKIETVLINRTEGKAMGVGETALIVVGAAISNAVFDATGIKLREVPFTPEKVKNAFAART
jgi:nicotinate dehydrogenase subunit B